MTLSEYMILLPALLVAGFGGFGIYQWYWRAMKLAKIGDSKMENDIKRQLAENNEVAIRADMEELEVYWTIKYACRHATTFTVRNEPI